VELGEFGLRPLLSLKLQEPLQVLDDGIVESPFATVRLRTTAAKRFKKVKNATALIWQILQVAESTFRRLKGAELLPPVYAGARSVDGRQRIMSMQQRVAA
jgi:putative transposase